MAIFLGDNLDNLIDGTPDPDILVGDAGNDTLTANEGNDLLAGDAGNDLVDGGRGDDTLLGGDGNDILEGAQGNDTMIGGAGHDILAWDDGDGSDRMSGGSGYDTVEFNGSVLEGDELVLEQQGGLAIFDRLNLVPIKLTVDSAEKFDISGLGGNDLLTVGNLSNTAVQVVKFSGNEGNDTLDGSGTTTRLVADGGSGNDVLIGGRANDFLYGGTGNDDIEGEKGNDTMIGGAGHDTLGWDDGDGSDRISGNAGYDTVEVDGSVLKGDQFVLKQQGNLAIFDRVNLGTFTLTVDSAEKFEVDGLGGNDLFTVNNLSNTGVQVVKFSGNEGNDTLDGSGTTTRLVADGGSGNDVLIGGRANDYLYGGTGNDDIEGEKGDDIMIGGAGDDTLGWDDGDGSDRISGNAGYDTVEVEGSDLKSENFILKQQGNLAIFDRTNLGPFTLTVDSVEKFEVSGLDGNDVFTVNSLSNTSVQAVFFHAGAGHDILLGSGASTRLLSDGGLGDDTLIGGNANDYLYGNAGDDRMKGGNGNDVLVGGAGSDSYVFNSGVAFNAALGVDTIKGFDKSGANFDKIVLDKSTFTFLNSVAGSGFSVANEFTTVASNVAAGITDAKIIYNSANGNLFYDTNGATAGFGAGGQFATLDPAVSLAASDFVIQA